MAFVNSMSGFVDSMGVCRFHENICRFYEGVCSFYEGVCGLYGGGVVDSVRGFRAQAHILCVHIYTATNANM